MNKSGMVTACVVTLCTTLASAAQDREARISRTFDVGTDGELSIANISGNIYIEGTSGGEITLEAVKRLHGRADSDLLEEVTVDMSHVGNRVRIETRYPRHRDRDRDHGRGGVSVEYRVSVPVGARVEARSVSGDVRVTSLEGETSVNSVSGEVRVTDAARLVRAKSVSGNVAVERARSDGRLEIASVSGEIAADDLEAEELDVASVSGDVTLSGVWSRRGEFDSVSGEIYYTGRIAEGGRYEFKSHSGDVLVTIGDDVGFELEASTFSGDIESDFEMRLSPEGRNRRSINAVVGDGSAVIEATTFSGDVVLRRR